MHDFQDEAKQAALRMILGKIPYLNPTDPYDCFIAIENGLFMSICNFEEKQLKYNNLKLSKQFEIVNNWTPEDVDNEHPTRKQVKNELNNISLLYSHVSEIMKENKLRFVFATIVD